MKRLFLILAILLVPTLSVADVIGAAGFSFDYYASDPGLSLMYGTEFNIDGGGDWCKGRALFSKVNWGNTVLDHLSFGGLAYTNLPWANWKIGGTSDIQYETADGELGVAIGGEIRYTGLTILGQKVSPFSGLLWLKKFGTKLPQDYVVITLGAVISF